MSGGNAPARESTGGSVRTRLGIFVSVVVGVVLMIPVWARATHVSSSVTPLLFTAGSGNLSCAEADNFLGVTASWNELKINGVPTNTTYNDLGLVNNPGGTGPLTVSITNAGNFSFTWSANMGVDVVIVKASDESNVFYYPGESTGDNAYSPLNTNTESPTDHHQISHVSFCYDVESTTTTSSTTSTTTSTTTTTTSTTTTTLPTSTTTSTTTTTVPTTTTTTTVPTTTTTIVGSPPVQPPEVPPAGPPTPVPGQPPFTG